VSRIGSGLTAFDPPAPVVPGSVAMLGGTFDPIHTGHLAIAEAAREQLGVERVLFVTAARPTHRAGGAVASADDRHAMVELAIAGNPAFEASRLELDRPGPTYTADTVEALAATPAAAGATAVTLVLSAETLRDLPGWHQPERILDACRIAVVPREGYPAPDGGWTAWVAANLAGREDRIRILEGPSLAISGTELRARAAAGRSLRYLVPDAVARYIDDHRLYRRDPAQ
jgi:nicotinate-nucleotide adenylyltransferase